MNDKVSVIIPIYNVEKYLRRCIESIIAQTYYNLEIILVDDGSPDKCPEICDDYALKDKRIKVIHKQNGGISDARNAGLKIFTGDYVYFFDSDDFVEKNLIEVALENAVATSSDVVIFNYYKVDEFDNLLATSNFKTGTYEIGDHNRIDYIVNIFTTYKIGCEVWNRLYKAEFIRNNNLLFWKELKVAEDYGFNLHVAFHANKITCISNALYYYLLRKGSAMSKAGEEPRLSDSLTVCKLLEERIMPSLRNTGWYKNYTILFYSIMCGQIRELTLENYKNSIYLIGDLEYLHLNIKRVIKYLRSSIIKYRGFFSGFIALLHCIFLLTRGLDRLYFCLMNICRKLQDIIKFISINKSKISSKNRIFLIENEDDRNLGDLYIKILQIEYLKSIFPECSMIEINKSEYLSIHYIFPLIIRKRDIICFSGGEGMGYISNFMYNNRRSIIKRYKKNRKFLFPLTMNYSLSDDVELQLEKDQNFIKQCKNITLCVKDLHSYELANKYFDCNIVLTPDMDLYSNYSKRLVFERKGAMLLLRNVREEILAQQESLLIENIVKQYTNDIHYNDIQLVSDISNQDRKDVVEAFISKIAKADIVITNLYYGMLLCINTHTPCIVLPDFNHNFEAVYDWTSKLEYIIRISDLCNLDDAVRKMLGIKLC